MNSKFLSLLILNGISVSLIGCSDSSTLTIKGSGSLTGSPQLLSVLDPTEFNLKIYKVAVSASTDCSGLITVYENANPDYENFLDEPTIGTGSLANGTYPCIVFEVSDNMTFKPAGSEGSCAEGETYTIDICRPDSTGSSTLIDGSITTCTGTTSPTRTLGDDRIAIYMSTGGILDAEAFSPDSPILLNAALEVSGSAVGTFVADGTGAIEGGNPDCDMGAPSFSFR